MVTDDADDFRRVAVTQSIMKAMMNEAFRRYGTECAIMQSPRYIFAEISRNRPQEEPAPVKSLGSSGDVLDSCVGKYYDPNPELDPATILFRHPVPPLHPNAPDVVAITTDKAFDALKRLVAKEGVASPWLLTRGGFNRWFSNHGAACVRWNDAANRLLGYIWKVSRDERQIIFVRGAEPEQPRPTQSGAFMVARLDGTTMPFSWIDPACPVCGGVAMLCNAHFMLDESGVDGEDHFTVDLVCCEPRKAKKGQTVCPKTARNEDQSLAHTTYAVTRDRFVFVSEADRVAGGNLMIDGSPDGATDYYLVRDIRTGVGRIEADPEKKIDAFDEGNPVVVTNLTYGGAAPALGDYSGGGADGWFAIPGHPEILHLKTHDWEGDEAGGDEALAEIGALLGLPLKEGVDANRQVALDAMARLDPATLAAWVDRWVTVPNVFATREDVMVEMWGSLVEWQYRLYGWHLVIEGVDDDFARLRAEAVAAGGGLAGFTPDCGYSIIWLPQDDAPAPYGGI